MASRELLNAVKTALFVLGLEDVQRWLGARSLWSALNSANERFSAPGDSRIDISSHVRRGKAGVLLLAWLADVLPQLGPRMTIPTLVVDASLEWIDATVVLWETANRLAAPS